MKKVALILALVLFGCKKEQRTFIKIEAFNDFTTIQTLEVNGVYFQTDKSFSYNFEKIADSYSISYYATNTKGVKGKSTLKVFSNNELIYIHDTISDRATLKYILE